MTTDRDMERARKALYDACDVLFTRAADPREDAAALRIIAAALAAERAPLEARIAELEEWLDDASDDRKESIARGKRRLLKIAELEAQLAEARDGLRALLAGLSLDDTPRRAAIDAARALVARWNGGSQKPSAIDEMRVTRATGGQVTTDRDMETARAIPFGLGDKTREAIAAALAAERAPLEAELVEVRRERNCAWLERDDLRFEVERLRAETLAQRHVEIDQLRTKLAEAERERDAYKRAKQENDERFQNERDEAFVAANASLVREKACRFEVERLRAELAAMHVAEERAELHGQETGARWGIEAAAGRLYAAGYDLIAAEASRAIPADVVRAAREREAVPLIDPLTCQPCRVYGQKTPCIGCVEREAAAETASVCPCEGEDDEPEPHIAACPYADPEHGNELPDMGDEPYPTEQTLTRADLDAFRGELVRVLENTARVYRSDIQLRDVLVEIADQLEQGR